MIPNNNDLINNNQNKGKGCRNINTYSNYLLFRIFENHHLSFTLQSIAIHLSTSSRWVELCWKSIALYGHLSPKPIQAFHKIYGFQLFRLSVISDSFTFLLVKPTFFLRSSFVHIPIKSKIYVRVCVREIVSFKESLSYGFPWLRFYFVFIHC